MSEQQAAADKLTAKKEQAEKELAAVNRRFGKSRVKIIFKAFILVIMLVLAFGVYRVANSEEAANKITLALTREIEGAEGELGFWMSRVEETMAETPGQVEALIMMVLSAVVFVFLATVGAGGTGIGWGLISALVGLCGMVYIFHGTHIMGYLPVPVCILAVAVKLRDAIRSAKQCADKQRAAAASLDNLNTQLAELSASKSRLESDRAEGERLYKEAVAKGNDEAVMAKAAELGNEDALAYMEEKEAQRNAEEAELLYQQATEKEEPDAELMEKAAEKGHPLANLYLGKELCRDVSAGIYTGKEKKAMLEQAVEHLDEAAEAGNVEAEFLAISCRAQYETHDAEGWHEMLSRLRVLKKSGLSEDYEELYTVLVQSVVEAIDKLDSAPPQTHREPRLVRKYCAFNNCGVCTFYSSSVCLAKCDYLNNPGDCSAALNQKALRYEYE